MYVQDEYNKADANQFYYMAKWIKLEAGVYNIYSMVNTTGKIKLDGNVIISPFTDLAPPNEAEFVVQQSGVYRFDCEYVNREANTNAFIAYRIETAGPDPEVIELSRANDFIADLVPLPDSALGPKPPYSDDVRLSYPVFLPMPNWKDGITERLEWQTDVMISETGAEQRRPIRLHPRRTFEGTFLRWDENRQVLDTTMAGIGTAPMLLPLWHDMTAVENDAPAGSVDIIAQIRVKDFNVGDVVIFRRDLTWDYEINIITALDFDAAHMTLQYGLQNDVGRGTRMYPVRVARVEEAMTGRLITGRVSDYQIRFRCTEPYELADSWSDMPIYPRTGLHIFTLRDNWKSAQETNMDRKFYMYDNESGVIESVDPGGQSQGTIKKAFQLHGRTADRQFRQLLFALRGRTKTFHLPQGTEDFILTRDINPSDGALRVRRCGYTQFVGSKQTTKRDIMIELYDGTRIPTTIISSRIVGNEEWLFLSQSIPATAMEDVRLITYMPVARLDVDGIEIKRVTDSAGVSLVSLTFKLFDDRREATPVPIQ
nr:hypothetical protein [Providencia rettgeri]